MKKVRLDNSLIKIETLNRALSFCPEMNGRLIPAMWIPDHSPTVIRTRYSHLYFFQNIVIKMLRSPKI